MQCMEHMFEAHMAPRGPLNLFSCFPQGSLLPDLGSYDFMTNQT